MSDVNEYSLTIHEVKIATIIRIVTSSISILSSITIIFMIKRSTKKLSTTQNRLLFGLSVSDLFFSIGQACGSVPIPKDSSEAWGSLGNIKSCEAQAFIIQFGATSAPLYNCAMSVFFLLKVKYSTNDDVMRRKYEPFFHAVPFLFATFSSVYPLVMDYYNPFAGVCWIYDYPPGCSDMEDIPCERGEGVYKDWLVRFNNNFAFVVPIVIFSTMINMYYTVRRQENRMGAYGRGSLNLSPTTESSRQERRMEANSNNRTRMVMYRGLSYTGAWFLTFIFPIIVGFHTWINDEISYPLQFLTAIFYPLQGFFNFLVFIYPKVILVHQIGDFTWWQAFVWAVSNAGLPAPEGQ